MNIIQLLKDFEGIIGALLGVVVTTLLNEFIKSKGKLNLWFDEFKYMFKGRSSLGVLKDSKNSSGADYFEYSFNLQLHNASDSKKILRNILIEFELQNQAIKNRPRDKSTEKISGAGITSNEFKIININPKEIIEVKFGSYISNKDTDLKELENIKRVYFTAIDEKEKKVRKVIIDLDKTKKL